MVLHILVISCVHARSVNRRVVSWSQVCWCFVIDPTTARPLCDSVQSSRSAAFQIALLIFTCELKAHSTACCRFMKSVEHQRTHR